MSGFLGGLFVGLFGVFNKLFGFKKTEYFVDLEDDTATPAPQKPAAPATPAAPAAPAPVVQAETAETEAKPAAAQTSKSKKTSIKSQKGAKAAPATNNGQAASLPPAPPKPEPVLVTFAPDNLMPIANPYRRRPGPSMNQFKAMAREVKVPRR